MNAYERTVDLIHEAMLDGFFRGTRGLSEPSRKQAQDIAWRFVAMASQSIQEGS